MRQHGVVNFKMMAEGRNNIRLLDKVLQKLKRWVSILNMNETQSKKGERLFIVMVRPANQFKKDFEKFQSRAKKVRDQINFVKTLGFQKA